MIELEMKDCNMILTEKQQKYQHYLSVKLINLPSGKNRIVEQAKFTYSSLGKAFEKQTKTIEDHQIKQVKSFKTRSKLRTRIKWRTFSKKDGKYCS